MFEKYLGKIVEVSIDRKIGDKHPKYDWAYPINYGEIVGEVSGDGDFLDAYVIGPITPLDLFKGKCIAIIERKDNPEDPKLVVVDSDNENISDQEILDAVNFQEKWFSPMIRRI